MLQAEWSGDRIPGEARFSTVVQTGPGAHPTGYTMGTGTFPWEKQPGRGFDHPTHPAPRLRKYSTMHVLPLWTYVACFKVTFTLNNFDVPETSNYTFQAFSVLYITAVYISTYKDFDLKPEIQL
jgi:hypothetical protein